ncbi:hypothetical protein NDU88_003012 [Pleurodeles waltl]|uniref:Uncharacterized protein n=1 Tax=Pleurodeles waltl TaxID=8319 RepID=A0AAV7TM74_PLEWA|nr:hypothetical protein NDU88_003012 [Pleurodeles waltl]
MDLLTGALVKVCAEISEDRSTQRHRERSKAVQMDAKTRAIGRLAPATTVLSSRAVVLQMVMSHISRDVSRGPGQIIAAVKAIQSAHITTCVGAEPPDCEISSVSGMPAT